MAGDRHFKAYYIITQRQAQQLIQELNGTKDPELSAMSCDEAYQLSDGTVVMNIPDLESWVFASSEEMLAYFEDTQKTTDAIASQAQEFPQLEALLSEGENFLAQIPRLIDDLSTRLTAFD